MKSTPMATGATHPGSPPDPESASPDASPLALTLLSGSDAWVWSGPWEALPGAWLPPFDGSTWRWWSLPRAFCPEVALGSAGEPVDPGPVEEGAAWPGAVDGCGDDVACVGVEGLDDGFEACGVGATPGWVAPVAIAALFVGVGTITLLRRKSRGGV